MSGLDIQADASGSARLRRYVVYVALSALVIALFPLMAAQPAQADDSPEPFQDPEYTSDAHASSTTIGGGVSGTVDLEIDVFPETEAASVDTQVYDRDVEYLLESDGVGLPGLPVDLVTASGLYSVSETDREVGHAE